MTNGGVERGGEGMRVVENLSGGLLGAVTLFAACSSSSEQADAGVGGTGGQADAHPFDINVDGAPPRPGTVRMAVPAYFAPPSPAWQRLIAGAPTIGMIVFNPQSGPGSSTD